MFRKFIVVFLAVALLAGMVGLGIHLLHKDARAYQVYYVWLWHDVGGEQVGAAGAGLDYRFMPDQEWGGWDDATEDGGLDGLFKFVYEDEGQPTAWSAEITGGLWVGVDPEGTYTAQWGDVTYFEWEFETTR